MDLPVAARAFFLCAACMGVAQYLAEERPMSRELEEGARALAPEIARLLRRASDGLGSEPQGN